MKRFLFALILFSIAVAARAGTLCLHRFSDVPA